MLLKFMMTSMVTYALDEVDKDIAITNSRKIVDARNYIIHGYDSLSVDILWSMVINHLPKLKNEVTALLNI